jgi:hypothetical protein
VGPRRVSERVLGQRWPVDDFHFFFLLVSFVARLKISCAEVTYETLHKTLVVVSIGVFVAEYEAVFGVRIWLRNEALVELRFGHRWLLITDFVLK